MRGSNGSLTAKRRGRGGRGKGCLRNQGSGTCLYEAEVGSRLRQRRARKKSPPAQRFRSSLERSVQIRPICRGDRWPRLCQTRPRRTVVSASRSLPHHLPGGTHETAANAWARWYRRGSRARRHRSNGDCVVLDPAKQHGEPDGRGNPRPAGFGNIAESEPQPESNAPASAPWCLVFARVLEEPPGTLQPGLHTGSGNDLRGSLNRVELQRE